LQIQFAVLDGALTLVVLWIAVGAAGLLAPSSSSLATRVLYPAGAAVAAALAVVGFLGLGRAPQELIVPLGLPDLPFHFRLDALSSFFLLLLGGTATGVSLFSAGYFRAHHAVPAGLIALEYHVFLASMAVVVLANDAYSFMVAWETMALSSYFLVTTEHHEAAIRRAGFIYLLIAHVGAVAILLCFGVLAGQGGYTFESMRNASLGPGWATVAFLLAFLGFGAKAGVVPLHVWLPEAHPAAPSPVSALLSGVMLKTAIYGLVRVTYDLVGSIQWQWGLLVLMVATMTTLFGVLFALMQHDLKRLLAYHSVENIGIILIGLGLSMIYIGTGQPLLGVLGLVAALYHTLNHALFKGLLFLGAGAVLHRTGIRDLGRMGGLIRGMPQTAFFFLIGALAISALPPLNGFVSEWLTFQSALLSPALSNGVLRSIIPAAAAALALAGALTAMCFVKVFGVTFLGAPRSPEAAASAAVRSECSLWERTGMALLALLCVVLGLLPVWMVGRMDGISRLLVGETLGERMLAASWLWLAPVAPERASYSPLVFMLVIAAVVLLTFWAVRALYHGRLRRTPPWDCGYPEQDARMQDTPEGFAQPIRQIFSPMYQMERHVPLPTDARPRYHTEIRDRFWKWIYFPVARSAEFASRQIGRIQAGSISIYLLYSFLTILFLLVFVR
jgi:formate hydrogenlyase subunit 3/multisubunit Na+/H+ antiporter MnhD subunit